MRLREDSVHIAGWKRAHALIGCTCGPDNNHVAHKPKEYPDPPAELEDIWVMRDAAGQVSGYAMTCPHEHCTQGVHAWTHAVDCHKNHDPKHVSCWTWTGSIEDGTLTGNPSLHVLASLGGCGWHGYLRDGEMVHV